MTIDLSKLGDDVDVETVVALAGTLLSIAVPASGVVISTIEAALPYAIRIYKAVKSDHFSQEEIDAGHALINANTAELEKPA